MEDDPRAVVAGLADDWTAVNAWLQWHPDLHVSYAAGTLMIHELDETQARVVLLPGAPIDAVVRYPRDGFVEIIRRFGAVVVTVHIRCASMRGEPEVLNPAAVA